MVEDYPTLIEFGLPSELGVEKLVRHALAWLLARWDIATARVADLQTAVSEACINAIEHGNQAQAQRRIGVTTTVTSGYVEVVVEDEGLTPYALPMAPPATIEHKLAGLAPARGMGLPLIGQLVDECGFLGAAPGAGNRFRLRIYR